MYFRDKINSFKSLNLTFIPTPPPALGSGALGREQRVADLVPIPANSPARLVAHPRVELRFAVAALRGGQEAGERGLVLPALGVLQACRAQMGGDAAKAIFSEAISPSAIMTHRLIQ